MQKYAVIIDCKHPLAGSTAAIERFTESGAEASEVLAAHYGDENLEAQLAEVDADFATSANLMQEAIAPLWGLGDLLDTYGVFPLTPKIVAREKAAIVKNGLKGKGWKRVFG